MNSRLLVAMLFALPAASASASSLRGSHASMVHQHTVAVKNDFTFLRTPKQVREFAASDRLDSITTTETYRTDGVSFPFARPVVKLFIERIAEQYRDATGSLLVITSLTRPTSLQPRNASPLSVHPTGMAVDLRVPADAASRSWLERTLLSLEDKGLLDVTREHSPSHYHVAVFPDAYASYVTGVATLTAATMTRTAALPSVVSAAMSTATAPASDDSSSSGSLPLPLLVAALGALTALLIALRARRRAASACSAAATGG